jgi:hypothetical protein
MEALCRAWASTSPEAEPRLILSLSRDVGLYNRSANPFCSNRLRKTATSVAAMSRVTRLIRTWISDYPSSSPCPGLRCPEQPARTDFGAVKHSLFHLSNPSMTCQLRDKATARDELAAVSKLRQVFDLVQVNLHCMEGRPVFLWAQEERAMDLVIGRTRLFAHLIFDAFFGLAADQSVPLTWVTSPRAVIWRSWPYKFPANRHGAIAGVLPSGDRGGPGIARQSGLLPIPAPQD